MESVEKSKYLRVKGQRIVVSDAVYQETVKQIHRTRSQTGTGQSPQTIPYISSATSSGARRKTGRPTWNCLPGARC